MPSTKAVMNPGAATTYDSVGTIAQNRERFKQYFEKGDKSQLGMEDFYKLLMAEMSNQDPMEPMSNTEFISQMATFTSLQTQTDALYYGNANYANSLSGKSVTVSGTDGTSVWQDTGKVDLVSMKNKEFFVTVNGKEYAMKSVSQVHDSANFGDLASESQYAASLIGYQVTVTGMTNGGEAFTEYGIVDHVEVRNNRVMIVINEYAYYLDDVVKVEIPLLAPPESEGTDVDGTGTVTDETAASEPDLSDLPDVPSTEDLDKMFGE